MAPQELHRFPNFPKEIQLLIWEEASNLVPPRVVELFVCPSSSKISNTSNTSDKSDISNMSIMSGTPCHPLLHTCQLSRKIMLRKWPLSFGRQDGQGQARIPFNSDLDTLCLDLINDFRGFASLISTKDRRAVKKIMLSPMIWGGFLSITLEDTYGREYDLVRNNGRDLQWEEEYCETLRECFPNLEKQIWTRLQIPFQWYSDRPYLLCPTDVPGRSSCLPETEFHSLVSEVYNRRGELRIPIEVGVELEKQIIGSQVDTWGYPLESNDNGTMSKILIEEQDEHFMRAVIGLICGEQSIGFDITKDFTIEEDEQIRRENAWWLEQMA